MVLKAVVGPLACNCYIVSCDASKEAVIIDPGAEPDKIRGLLKKNSLDPKYIINTHGHGDHIAQNGAFGLPVLIHKSDEEYLRDPYKNLSSAFFLNISSPGPARLLEDGERIEFGKTRLSVIHTPGHTPGSISLYTDGILFTGDTLFAGGIGRTDLPDGDERAILKSINERIMILPDDVIIYPGHGPESTIGEERRENPFL